MFDDALRELEGKPPLIATPSAITRAPNLRRFVPNNSKNWPPQRKLNPKKGYDLEPEPIRSWDIYEPHAVWYYWPNAAPDIVNTVRQLSRRVWSVGKGEDFAVLEVTDEPLPDNLATWQEVAERDVPGVRLEIPEHGCLDLCDNAFWRHAGEPPLPTAGIRAVRYKSEGVVDAQAPTVVLAMRSQNQLRSWDARLLHQLVGIVRNLLDEIRSDIVDVLVGNSTERPRLDALTRRVLLGYDERGEPVREPHLAVLPIPSLRGPYPDGRIRRLAIVGFGCGQDSERRSLVELAGILLHGRELVDRGRKTGVKLEREQDGKWLEAITRKSRTWVSVTPVIQPGHELTSAEWKRLRSLRRTAAASSAELGRLEQRLRARRLELVVRSLAQAAVDAYPVSVELVPGGPIAGVHIPGQYRVAGYLAETSRLHLRVTLDREVTGPIAAGRGRHVGFGLLWPEHS